MQAEIRIWFSKTSKFNMHLPKLLQLLGTGTLYPRPSTGAPPTGDLRLRLVESKNSLNYALSKTPSPIHVIYLHSKAQC